MIRLFVRYRWFGLVLLVALSVDLATKEIVFDRLGLPPAAVHEAVERGWERYDRQTEAFEEWREQVDAATERQADADPATAPQSLGVPGPPEEPRLFFSFESRHQYEIVADYLYFTAVLNPGAFGGLLGGQVLFLLVLSLIAVVIVGWFLVRTALPRYQVVVGLIVAGALGNMFDRVVFGAVRDFVDFRLPEAGVSWLNPWNTFNFADSAIVGGILALLVLEFFFPIHAPKRKEAAAGDDNAAADEPA